MAFIEVSNLEKNYTIYEKKSFMKRNKKIVNALKGISFTVDKGDFIGYIGPNGAGKSTTIKILTGIMNPNSGHVKVGDYVPYHDRKKYVANIGVVFGQKTQMWWDLPVINTYELLKGIYKISDRQYDKQLAYLKEKLFLEDILNHPVRQLSLGQRMRAELGACMIHDPDILFLDEPTIGLDIVSKHRVIEFLREINESGKTIFLTTHDMKDIETLCNEMLVLNHGDIVYKGQVDKLKEITELPTRGIAQLEGVTDRKVLDKVIKKCNGSYDPVKGQLTFDSKCKKETSEIAKLLFNNYDVEDFRVEEPTIEEIIKLIYMEA